MPWLLGVCFGTGLYYYTTRDCTVTSESAASAVSIMQLSFTAISAEALLF
jgi:hypothetical protein